MSKRRFAISFRLVLLLVGASALAYVAIQLPYSKLHYIALFLRMFETDRDVGMRGRSNGRIEMLYGFNAPRDLYERGLRYAVVFNDEGFRNTEPGGDFARGTADGSVAHVLCIGDSVLFGQDVGQGKTIAENLQRLLNGRRGAGRPLRVWNIAMPGHNTTNLWLKTRHYVPRFSPAALVLSASFNDRYDECGYTIEAKEAFYRRVRRGSGGAAAFFRSLYDVARGAVAGECEPGMRVPPGLCAERFRDILALAGNVPVVVLTTELHEQELYLPLREALGEFGNVRTINQERFLFEEARRRTFAHERFAGDLAAIRERFRDPRSIEESEILGVTSDGGHPNEIGSTLLAEEIADHLLALGL